MSARRPSRTDVSWMAPRERTIAGASSRSQLATTGVSPRIGSSPATGAAGRAHRDSRQRPSARAHSWQPCRVCQTGSRRAAPRCRTHRANRLAAAEVATSLRYSPPRQGPTSCSSQPSRIGTPIGSVPTSCSRHENGLEAGAVGHVFRRSGCGCECQVRSAVRRLGERSDDDRARHPLAASASGVDQVDVVVRQTAIGSDERCATQLGLGDEQAVERIMMVER